MTRYLPLYTCTNCPYHGWVNDFEDVTCETLKPSDRCCTYHNPPEVLPLVSLLDGRKEHIPSWCPLPTAFDIFAERLG